MFIRPPLYELMPPVLTDPRLKQKKAITNKPENSIHRYEDKMLGQEDMMKTFFPQTSRVSESQESNKPTRKRGGSKQENQRHFNSIVEPGGSHFEGMKMTGGVAMFEGIRTKRGGFDPSMHETLSRTQYLDQLSMTQGNLSN